ncbi:MAG: M28 family peptidase [Prevotellaceae bacterium]|jgi:hypothetical protein|nr:M28 family peptidase [Prevotellaceae bacterium]
MVKYIKHTLLLAILFTVSCGIFAQKPEISKYVEQIDSVKIRITLSTLASDEFEGRGTGKQGGEIAQEYIVACLDLYGVKPGNNNSYFQSINQIKSFNVAKKQFTVDNVDFPDDYKYENSYYQDTVLKINEIIFIVSGTETAGIKLDNIEGKVIMKLNDTPSHFLDSLNPATVINIFPTFKPVSSVVSERLFFTPPESNYKYNRVNISVNLADQLLKSTGKTLKEITGEVEKSGKSKVFTLKTSAEIHGNVIYHKTNVSNIVGIIEGSDLKNEYVILSAHHDHVGIINEEIYNGADDNASGVSSVLEIARLLAKAKNEGNGLRRSVVFLFFAAEEMGLIGSNYYVHHPVFPLTDAKACINVDMVGRIDNKYESTKGNYIYIVNDEKTNGDLLEIAGKSNSDSIVLNTKDHNSLFNRSDHYNFARNNIPSIVLTSGLHEDYHTPRDEVKLIDFNAMWKRNRFMFSLIWNLANGD